MAQPNPIQQSSLPGGVIGDVPSVEIPAASAPLSLPWVTDPTGTLAPDFAVIRAATANVKTAAFGAKGDGSEAAAAIQAAINSLPQTGNQATSGGIVEIPPGDYLISNPLVVDGLNNITIRGAGARYGGSRLLVAGSVGISAVAAFSPVLENIALVNTNPAYAGKLVDFTQANFPTMRRVRSVLAQQAGITAFHADVLKSITLRAQECYFTGGAKALYGARVAGDFVNAAVLDHCYFEKHDIIPIHNLGALGAGSAIIQACVFEPLLNGNAGAYLQDAAIPFQGVLSLLGNWVGDGNGAGTWVTFNGWSLLSLMDYGDATNAILANGEIRSLAVGGFISQNGGKGGVNLGGQAIRSLKDLGLYASSTPAWSGASNSYGSGGGGSLGAGSPAVQVIKTAAQAIAATGTNTVMAWDALDFDTLNNLGLQWANANPTRLVCKVPGIYRISATIVWAANTTGDRAVSFKLNGGTFIGGSRVPPNILGTATTDQQATVIKQLNAGDFVECWVMQNAVAGLNVNVSDGGTNTPTAFSMERIS